MRELRHPNIVNIVEAFTARNSHRQYIVMEYCARGDLHELMQSYTAQSYVAVRRLDSLRNILRLTPSLPISRPIPEQMLTTIMVQLVVVLHFCHTPSATKPIVCHRDLKPANGERSMLRSC